MRMKRDRAEDALRAGSAAGSAQEWGPPLLSRCSSCTPLSGNTFRTPTQARCSAGAGNRQEEVPVSRCSQLMRGTGQVATDFPSGPGRAPGSPLLSLQHGRCPPWPGPLLQTACCLAARFSYAILVGSKQGLIGPAQGKWGWVGPVRPGKAEGSRQWSTEASGLRA